MNVDGCIFCGIVEGRIPSSKIYEDEEVLAFLDIAPLSEGHILVISKRHYAKLHQCPPNILNQIGCCLPKIASAMVAAVNCDGYNVLCNNGRCAGQLVEHMHFHIIPRNEGDGLFGRWPAKQYPVGKMEMLAAKIRENL